MHRPDGAGPKLLSCESPTHPNVDAGTLNFRMTTTKDFARMPIDLQVAVSIFKGDFFTPPKVWGDQTYSKLFYWNEVPKGGHFAALEQPELFVAELRKSFAQVR